MRTMSSLPELGGLRAELRAAGVFGHHEVRSWLKLATLLGALAGCLVALATFGWVAIGVIPIAGVLATSVSMMGHEGSHRSFSSSPWRNEVLVYLTFPLFSGLSSLYWRNKHDRLHHGHPNVEGLDPDIRPWPFVSSRGDHDRSPRQLRWFQRTMQRRAVWPMSTLMTLGMRRASLIYLATAKRTPRWWAEVACMAVHYTCWLVIPSIVWGPLVGFGVYSAIWAIVGICLALVFAPAHMGLPILDGQHHDWLHQIETTRNLALPRVVSFFFIGLDYQVEHHLFPKIPHQSLPRAAAITAAWCAEHGIKHHHVPYLTALADSVQFIADAWQREAASPIDVRAANILV